MIATNVLGSYSGVEAILAEIAFNGGCHRRRYSVDGGHRPIKAFSVNGASPLLTECAVNVTVCPLGRPPSIRPSSVVRPLGCPPSIGPSAVDGANLR